MDNAHLVSGAPFDGNTPEMRSISNRAKDLARAYNAIPTGDNAVREDMLRHLFGKCGRNVRVNQPVFVDYGVNTSIGDNSLINMNCTLLDTAGISIGSNTLIGPDVKIYTATHPQRSEERFFVGDDGQTHIRTLVQPVTIGNGVWIGGGAIILPGVSIGDNALIGAGSVVTQDIPANVVACGVPCTVKKTL